MSQQNTISESSSQAKLLEKIPAYIRQKKRWFIGGLATAAILGGIFVPRLLDSNSQAAVLDLSDTTVLQYVDLQSTISASGTVESAQSTMVYSTNPYTVMGVHVEVGDYVEAGQLLADLDDQNIQDQITSQELSLAASQRGSSEQIKAAKTNYDNFKYGLDNGLNSGLSNAQNQVENALEAYNKAKLTYDRYLQSLNLGENTAVLNAEAALRSAESAVDAAYKALESAEEAYDDAWDGFMETEDALDEAYDVLFDLREDLREAKAELEKLEADADQKTELRKEKDVASAKAEELKARKIELESIPENERTPEETVELAELPAQINAADSEVARLESLLAESEDSVAMQAKILQLRLTVATCEQQYNSADAAVAQLESAREQAESLLESTEKQIDNAYDKIEDAEENYNAQVSSYNASMTNVDNTLADYAKNMETSWESYQDAMVALETARKSAQDQLQTYANTLSSARNNANTDSAKEHLRQLQVDLEGTKITAPCAGTVTAVYAKVGSSGSGLLFVIEDVEDLIIDTSVKGYDIGTVKEGMQVIIRSDATGDTLIDGHIDRIAPTSNKTIQGTTDTNGDAVFAAEVLVTEKNTGLRIGMEAQLDYVIEEANHVLAVPYDAVYENEAGETCVLAAIEQADGSYLIREIVVTTGMDDDLDMVIKSPELTEGMRIIELPDTYLAYRNQYVTIGTRKADPLWMVVDAAQNGQ